MGRTVKERLWDPERRREVRRINRWTLAATAVLLSAGAILVAAEVPSLGGLVVLAGILAFLAGTVKAARASGVPGGPL